MAKLSLYRSTTRALQYVISMHLDISTMVYKLSRSLQAHVNVHGHTCERVFCYCKGIITHSFHFQTRKHFINVDWASYLDDKQSTSSCSVFLRGILMSRSSKKQNVAS